MVERGGYAGMRTKVRSTGGRGSLSRPSYVLTHFTMMDGTWQSRTTLFGTRTWDTSLHAFLRLRVRSSGDGMRYFVNIQTDGPGALDLPPGRSTLQISNHSLPLN